MPGVTVTTAVRTGPVGVGDIVAGQVFMVGETERGSVTEPVLLRSFSDYTKYYGDYQTGNLYSHVKTYFSEGGTRCYVQRILGSGSATGSLTLDDASGSATMEITAANPGAWSDNVEVEVAAPDVAGFKINVYHNNVLKVTTRDLTDVTDAITVLNASSVSDLIVASDDATSSADPDALAATALSGGSDGSAPIDSEATAGLDLLSENLKSGAVCLPGRSGATIWAALRDHAAENHRVAICGFAEGDSDSAVKTAASAYYAHADARYMSFYYPHITVEAPSAAELAEGASPVAGSTLSIDPTSFAAAARTRAIQDVGGPWRAGAGVISQARTISGISVDVTPTVANLLDDARINALRVIGGSVRVYGARSVSSDEVNWKYITLQDTINYIVYGVEDRMEEYLFSTIDGRGSLFGRVRASIKGLLEPIRVSGGLYEAYDSEGALIDPGYSVTVDDTLNPNDQLAAGLVKAQVGVRVSGVADQIQVVITKSNLTAAVI